MSKQSQTASYFAALMRDCESKRRHVTVEDAFWAALQEIAAAQGTTISQLIAAIDSERRKRQHINLSSAIRLFVLDYYRI
jgi:predicted DNA-binding ribbon-helix-helix protein